MPSEGGSAEAAGGVGAQRRRESIAAAVRARDALRLHRRGYHLALVIAHDWGATTAELADALGTEASYVANTLGRHREGRCGCGAPAPRA